MLSCTRVHTLWSELQQLPGLAHLEIFNAAITVTSARNAQAALPFYPSLVRLQLNKCSFTNATAAKIWFGAAARVTVLELIPLSRDIQVLDLTPFGNLQELFIVGNYRTYDSSLLENITALQSLHVLALEAFEFPPGELPLLLEKLNSLPGLQMLSLRANNIIVEELDILLASQKIVLPYLTHLDLGTAIGTKAVVTNPSSWMAALIPAWRPIPAFPQLCWIADGTGVMERLEPVGIDRFSGDLPQLQLLCPLNRQTKCYNCLHAGLEFSVAYCGLCGHLGGDHGSRCRKQHNICLYCQPQESHPVCPLCHLQTGSTLGRLTLPVFSTLLPDWRILRVLGEGSYGVVVEIINSAGLRRAAKVVRLALELTTKRTAIEELVALAELRTAGVIQLLEAYLHPDGEHRVIITELAGPDFGSLRQWHPVPVEIALRLAIGLFRMLASVHKCGWVHTDIHPCNIAIRLPVDFENPQVVLLDLGRARTSVTQYEQATDLYRAVSCIVLLIAESVAGFEAVLCDWAAYEARLGALAQDIWLREQALVPASIIPLVSTLYNMAIDNQADGMCTATEEYLLHYM